MVEANHKSSKSLLGRLFFSKSDLFAQCRSVEIIPKFWSYENKGKEWKVSGVTSIIMLGTCPRKMRDISREGTPVHPPRTRTSDHFHQQRRLKEAGGFSNNLFHIPQLQVSGPHFSKTTPYISQDKSQGWKFNTLAFCNPHVQLWAGLSELSALWVQRGRGF
jgi:hypothetical protein